MEPGQTALEDQLVVTTAVVTVVLLTAVLVEECHIFLPQTIPQQQAGTLMGHFWAAGGGGGADNSGGSRGSDDGRGGNGGGKNGENAYIENIKSTEMRHGHQQVFITAYRDNTFW